jgi:SNF2 family DNA or RNA helicase
MAKGSSLKINLNPHQQTVADYVQRPDVHGLVVYHGLGSGKTITSIASAEPFGGANVITPAPLQDNFKKEIKKVKAKGRYFPTSYEKFVRNPGTLTDKFVIIDEAHRLKNLTSQRAQVIKDKTADAKKVLLLTGTPIQNKPHDIANLINIAAGGPVLPEDPKEFNKRYIGRKTIDPGFFNKVFKGIPTMSEEVPINMKDLARRVKGRVSYFAPKKSLDEYPTVSEKNVPVTMTPRQTEVYSAIEKKLPANLKYKIQHIVPPTKADSNTLNYFLSAVRQVSNTPQSFDIEASSANYPKLNKVVHSIQKSEGPSLVFSNYLDSGLKPISSALSKKGISHGLYTGELPHQVKKELVDKYNKGKLKALLISSSGGEGLDLKNTSDVHIIEPSWNEARTEQMIGRAVRYKSHSSLPPEKRHVNVHRYIATFPEERPNIFQKIFGIPPTQHRTADEYLYGLGRKKTELNDQFLDVLKKNSI